VLDQRKFEFKAFQATWIKIFKAANVTQQTFILKKTATFYEGSNKRAVLKGCQASQHNVRIFYT
jgi:hypothetical protein